METKLSKLEKAFRAGNYREALRIASKFHELGEQKEAITRAWAAIQSPDFYSELGYDPAHLEKIGIDAISARYKF
jgi:hypothetical protein